jgi:cytochrome c biogenesis protein CcdA/thiol-disulfide isomerase/thioredoxin
VIVLLGIGFLAGVVTALSPCVLPVLPVLLAGGATGRKPLRIVTGLILSFVVFTLFAAWLLDSLGLPKDLLRNLAIAMLFLVAATLLVPRLALALERPFAGLTRFRAGGGGFLLGVSLGLVFVPCAGPVLAAVTVVAANNDVGLRAVLLTTSYALGAAVPMALIAFGGRGLAGRLRAHADTLRFASGVAIGLVALAFAFNVDTRFQTAVPGYTEAFQERVEQSSSARRELSKLRPGQKELVVKTTPTRGSTAGLPDYGTAPSIKPGGDWFNSEPLTLRQLRGKVVIVDFWTYSCINCLRTLPHLKAWDDTYRDKGLVILGVHTPEFAFEHESSNVREAIGRLGIRYPVVQDNDFATWDNYANQYWPAKYMIDREGHIRYVHFGEGAYEETEALIRKLLGANDVAQTKVDEDSPTRINTPESYLGYERLARYEGDDVKRNRLATYMFPKAQLALDGLAYDGGWRVERERIVAGEDAKLRLRFQANDVFLVLGGKGKVSVTVDGLPARTVDVDGYRLYTLLDSPERTNDGLLELGFTPGVQAYAFTFGG